MKLTKCPNGHYYDAEKFPSCPHCSGGASGSMGAMKDDDGSTESFVPGQASPSGGSIPRGGAMNDGVTVSSSGLGAVAPSVPSSGGYTPPAQQQNQPADDGKTVGFYVDWGNQKQKDEEAAQKQARKEQTRPVVGWLVCVDGSNFGKSFELYFGRNFIGRDNSMDVCLAGDNTISRNRHAILIYEPKQRMFFAQPGESHELFYLNDEVVLNSVQLKDRDRITIGKTTLVFVPFCDESFGWD